MKYAVGMLFGLIMFLVGVAVGYYDCPGFHTGTSDSDALRAFNGKYGPVRNWKMQIWLENGDCYHEGRWSTIRPQTDGKANDTEF